MNLKKLRPIFYENSRVPVWLSKIAPINVWANSFAIWVWCRGEMSEKTKRHETIHFQQQLECLFVFQWILYGFHYLVLFVKYKGDGKKAYHNICFEREAYEHDKEHLYLENRKRYNWIKYIWRPEK